VSSKSINGSDEWIRFSQLAAAHHRLLWMPPFLDGNGRVTRLMSHAMLLDALDTGGIWSVAPARNVAPYVALLRRRRTAQGHFCYIRRKTCRLLAHF